MSKWIAEFELEDGDILPEHMDLEFRGARIDFHCRPLEQEPTTNNGPIDYCRAFKIACELLNGSVLYGIDADRIFEIMMAKDGVVSSDSYESYILNNLQELDRGQYASEPTPKNDCAEQNGCMSCLLDDGDDCCRKLYEESMQEPITKNDLGVDLISRADVLKLMKDNWHTHNGDWAMQESMDDIRALPSVTPQESRWIPVSERLPEPNRLVLCHITTGVTETYFLALWNDTLSAWEEGIGGCRLLENDLGYEVIEWMSLPKFYKSEIESQESEDT